MSTSKHFDKICLVVLAVAVVITVLFMNGAALGIQPLTEDDGGTVTPWNDATATAIVFSENGAAVVGSGAYSAGSDVTVSAAGDYRLSGTGTGSLTVDAEKGAVVRLKVDGLTLENPDGAAIFVKQAKTTTLILAGENALSGVESTETDGVIYSKDDLVFSGDGALAVTAKSGHGVVCNDTLTVESGTIAVIAARDGIHGNDGVTITGGALTLTADDDGISVKNDEETGVFRMEAGTLTIPQSVEGIESNTVEIAGGDIAITCTDDGVNACGSGAASVTVSGGKLTVLCPDGMDADGIDSNGDLTVTGGDVFISVNGRGGSNNALDYGSENGGTCSVTGGTVIACGASGMAETFDKDASAQAFLFATVSGNDNAALTLADESGTVLLSATVPSSFSAVTLSCPELSEGQTYTLSVDSEETTVTAGESAATGSVGGQMMGRGQPNGFGGGQQPPQMPNGEEMGGGEQPPQMPNGEEMGGGEQPPQMPNGEEMGNGEQPPQMPDGTSDTGVSGGEASNIRPENKGDDTSRADEKSPSFDKRQGGDRNPLADNTATAQENPTDSMTWILLGVSGLVLVGGLLFAGLYKR